MKILLIDDNEHLTQIYQMIITHEGHHVDIELDSSQAINRIRTEKPELVLLDIMMEPLSGWEVLEQIRMDAALSEIPVIILTGKMMTINEAISYGMQIEGYVMKPLERSMLVTAIREVEEILTECDDRYRKAITAGLTEEKATQCRRMVRKKKMLFYLMDLLARQERILSLRPDEQEEMKGTLNQLRMIIKEENTNSAQEELTCP